MDRPLPDTKKDFLRRWIDAGLPNGETPNTPTDAKLVPTYASIDKHILGTKCIQCHNPQGSAKFLDLSSREMIWKERKLLFDFDAPEKSYIVQVISDSEEPMPPRWSDLDQVDKEEIEVITKWIGAGLP